MPAANIFRVDETGKRAGTGRAVSVKIGTLKLGLYDARDPADVFYHLRTSIHDVMVAGGLHYCEMTDNGDVQHARTQEILAAGEPRARHGSNLATSAISLRTYHSLLP